MSNIAVMYENFAENSVFSFGSWLTNLPLDNMKDSDLGTLARSSDALVASTKFRVDLGAVRPIGGVAVGPTNLSPGAQYRVRSYEDNLYTTLLYDSGIKILPGASVDSLELEWEDPGFWYGIETEGLSNAWIIEVIPETQISNSNAQYWQIEMIDESNSDGYIEAGFCMIGRTFRPSINYDENNSFTQIQLTDTIEALGGHRDYWHRGMRRTLRVTWWRLDDSEGWGDIYAMMTILGVHRPMFVVPDPDDLDNIQKRSFLATFRNTPELRLIIQDGVTTGFDLEEVL